VPDEFRTLEVNMSQSQKDIGQTHDMLQRLQNAGIDRDDAWALRRISMTLHRWHELECGTDSSCIVRGKWDKESATFIYDDNGAPHFEYAGGSGRARYSKTRDDERGALKRLAGIMARYPTLTSYVQTDPRGAALYILRPGDVREGASVDSCYINGIAVYR
jgi:hypothetical protein